MPAIKSFTNICKIIAKLILASEFWEMRKNVMEIPLVVSEMSTCANDDTGKYSNFK